MLTPYHIIAYAHIYVCESMNVGKTRNLQLIDTHNLNPSYGSGNFFARIVSVITTSIHDNIVPRNLELYDSYQKQAGTWLGSNSACAALTFCPRHMH